MLNVWIRINALLLFLVLAALLAVLGLLANEARGGSLDPAGAPASTMKSLDDIPGSWSRKLPSNDGAPGPNPLAGCNSSRFKCTDVGILDLETGLVWSDGEPSCCPGSWANAVQLCRTAFGSRIGWRLPSVEELQSLMDLTAGNPVLPAGHPFFSIGLETDDLYWTSTQTSATTAWALGMDGTFIANEPMSNSNYAWCVRGGSSS